jgi:hypothetical protein
MTILEANNIRPEDIENPENKRLIASIINPRLVYNFTKTTNG